MIFLVLECFNQPLSFQQEENSWALASLAALYWRVRGDAVKAVDCLRLSVTNAPPDVKDIPLVGLANILHRAARYNDAIALIGAALDFSNDVAVTHFTLANLYASKVS